MILAAFVSYAAVRMNVTLCKALRVWPTAGAAMGWVSPCLNPRASAVGGRCLWTRNRLRPAPAHLLNASDTTLIHDIDSLAVAGMQGSSRDSFCTGEAEAQKWYLAQRDLTSHLLSPSATSLLPHPVAFVGVGHPQARAAGKESRRQCWGQALFSRGLTGDLLLTRKSLAAWRSHSGGTRVTAGSGSSCLTSGSHFHICCSL